MKQYRTSFALMLLIALLFSFVSCKSSSKTDDPQGDDEYDEFKAVEMKADAAFGDTSAFPPEDDPFHTPSDTKPVEQPKDTTTKETPPKTTPEPDVDEMNLERYEKYWSQRRDPNYPSSQFFIGVGQAHYTGEHDKSQAMQKATADARAEIRAIFRAEIRSHVETEQQKMETIKGEVRQASFFIKSTYNLEQSVSGTVEGAKPSGVAFDTKHNFVYVLVTLDRKRAADMINEDLKRLRSEIQGSISTAETARNNKNLINAAKLLSSSINLISQFRLKMRELIFVMPAGYQPVTLDGIDEAVLIQLLSEITVNLTIMVKTRVTYIDDKGNEEVKDNDPISAAIKRELDKSSSNLISLKIPSAALLQAKFDEVRYWGVEELRAAAPEAQFIVLADLTVSFTGMIKYARMEGFEAKTEFSINMIDTDSGSVTPLFSDGNAVEKSKAQMNQLRTAMNSSVNFAAKLVADAIFGWLNP